MHHPKNGPQLALVRPSKADADALLEAFRWLERDKEMQPALERADSRAQLRRFAAEPEPITGFGALA